jgi:hypothetical protein
MCTKSLSLINDSHFHIALQPLWTLAAFQFLNLYTVGRSPWTRDQLVAWSLPTNGSTQTQNKRTQTSTPRMGFEPTISVFERAKMVHALDREATLLDIYNRLLAQFHHSPFGPAVLPPDVTYILLSCRFCQWNCPVEMASSPCYKFLLLRSLSRLRLSPKSVSRVQKKQNKGIPVTVRGGL